MDRVVALSLVLLLLSISDINDATTTPQPQSPLAQFLARCKDDFGGEAIVSARCPWSCPLKSPPPEETTAICRFPQGFATKEQVCGQLGGHYLDRHVDSDKQLRLAPSNTGNDPTVTLTLKDCVFKDGMVDKCNSIAKPLSKEEFKDKCTKEFWGTWIEIAWCPNYPDRLPSVSFCRFGPYVATNTTQFTTRKRICQLQLDGDFVDGNFQQEWLKGLDKKNGETHYTHGDCIFPEDGRKLVWKSCGWTDVVVVES